MTMNVSTSHVSNRVRYSRIGLYILAWIFAVCIVIQTLFAGFAIFTDATYWTYHSAFVPWFQFIPIVMLILSFTGKLPKTIRWQSVGLLLLIVPMQYANVHIPGMGAIHPVIALILFWRVVTFIKQTGSWGQEITN